MTSCSLAKPGVQVAGFVTLSYENDTIKEARIQVGTDDINVGRDVLLQRNATAQFRRQLIDTQFVGEFKFDDLTVDLRGTYANSKRLAPYERFNNYAFSAQFKDYVNDLRSPGQSSLDFVPRAIGKTDEYHVPPDPVFHRRGGGVELPARGAASAARSST